MRRFFKKISNWFLLILLVVGFCLFFYFRLYEYLNFSTLKKYHRLLIIWKDQHYLLSVIIYMSVYISSVAMSVPGALVLTIAGGFLFGPIATIYVVISATIGGSILFLAVRSTLGEWLSSKVSGWMRKMERGFRENAFNYLLILRLVPLFPFWAVNIVAGLISVRFKTFVIATFLGIIPGTFIYVMVGNSLRFLSLTEQTPNLNIIFTPSVLLPLLGLAILALLPVIYKQFNKK